MESRYLDRANPSKKRGKQYATFVCSNAFYGPNGLPTRFHFKFRKDSNKDADGTISSNVSMVKMVFQLWFPQSIFEKKTFEKL